MMYFKINVCFLIASTLSFVNAGGFEVVEADIDLEQPMFPLTLRAPGANTSSVLQGEPTRLAGRKRAVEDTNLLTPVDPTHVKQACQGRNSIVRVPPPVAVPEYNSHIAPIAPYSYTQPAGNKRVNSEGRMDYPKRMREN